MERIVRSKIKRKSKSEHPSKYWIKMDFYRMPLPPLPASRATPAACLSSSIAFDKTSHDTKQSTIVDDERYLAILAEAKLAISINAAMSTMKRSHYPLLGNRCIKAPHLHCALSYELPQKNESFIFLQAQPPTVQSQHLACQSAHTNTQQSFSIYDESMVNLPDAIEPLPFKDVVPHDDLVQCIDTALQAL